MVVCAGGEKEGGGGFKRYVNLPAGNCYPFVSVCCRINFKTRGDHMGFGCTRVVKARLLKDHLKYCIASLTSKNGLFCPTITTPWLESIFTSIFQMYLANTNFIMDSNIQYFYLGTGNLLRRQLGLI